MWFSWCLAVVIVQNPFWQLQSFILIACFVPDFCGCFSVVVVVAVVLFSGVLWLLLLVSCRLAVVVVVLMFVGVPSLFLDVVCFASLGSLLFDYCFWLPVVVLIVLLFSCFFGRCCCCCSKTLLQFGLFSFLFLYFLLGFFPSFPGQCR